MVKFASRGKFYVDTAPWLQGAGPSINSQHEPEGSWVNLLKPVAPDIVGYGHRHTRLHAY